MPGGFACCTAMQVGPFGVSSAAGQHGTDRRRARERAQKAPEVPAAVCLLVMAARACNFGTQLHGMWPLAGHWAS